MRILHLVAGEKWTGAAAVVLDQTAALVAAGVEAQFGFVRDSPLAARLFPIGWARPLLSPARDRLRFIRDVRELRQTIDRELFDIVHCHASHDHFVAAGARRPDVTGLVRTIHNLGHARGDPLTRRLFRRTDAFAFANGAIAAKFGGGGPVLPPVVDPVRFSPREKPSGRLARLGVPERAFVIGTVGKLAAGRGHREAIEAAAPLPADTVLLHVGKGELRPELEARTAALGTASRNFWAGYADDDLPELYRAMDVFLFPASGSDQGQRALLEAMASGVPVVAVDVPGVADLVTNGQEGLVVSRPADLELALRRLRDSPNERARMAERARERAREFDGSRFAARAIDLYRGVVERKSSTSRAWDATETEG
jgi:glycosyltransferase involved in cell wall biosynthesis